MNPRSTDCAVDALTYTIALVTLKVLGRAGCRLEHVILCRILKVFLLPYDKASLNTITYSVYICAYIASMFVNLEQQVQNTKLKFDFYTTLLHFIIHHLAKESSHQRQRALHVQPV